MPLRKTLLVNQQHYHVFNRSIAKEPIFLRSKDYIRFNNLVDYYRFKKPSLRYSFYNRLEISDKAEYLRNLHESGEKLVQILAFCWMPTHYHLLLKQLSDNGISDFLRNLQNSYAKYFNTKYQRSGSLFQEMFKAVIIQSDEQLTHIIRYIHLNPLTDYLLKDIKEIETYKWTSFPSYITSNQKSFVETNFILKHFKNSERLKIFTYNQVDYQRKLSRLKHLSLERC